MILKFVCALCVQDAEAGRKGLAACANLMQNYDQCMTKIPAKSLVRVSTDGYWQCCITKRAHGREMLSTRFMDNMRLYQVLSLR